MLNLQTVLVASTSLVTGVISVAMLLLVYWQAPRRRTNQLFALMMLLLAVFCLFNLSSRFVEAPGDEASVIFAITSITYGWMLVIMYYFSEEFTENPHRPMQIIGIILAITAAVTTISGLAYRGPFQSTVDEQGYYVEYKLSGILAVIAALVYLILTTIRMRRNPDPRPQAIWTAGVVMLFGAVMVFLRPLSNSLDHPWSEVLTFPYNAVSLGIAALIMGRAVLQAQLFDPLHMLNQKLQKTNQELEQANQHKDLFLASMSHELRTPLNAIIGYTELLRQGIYGPVTEQQVDRLQKVSHNSRRLLNLINDVLDLSKIASGGIGLQPVEISAQELIEQVTDSLASLAKTKGLSLVYDIEPEITLRADPQRLNQVLVNLIGNAIKFTDEGSISITARRENSSLHITIKDTGIGIPADSFSELFQEFYQVDSGSTRKYEGTGLGLAISKRIVEMHGGKIEFESIYGQGSSFHIRLPLT